MVVSEPTIRFMDVHVIEIGVSAIIIACLVPVYLIMLG